jgi:hypothetical protein
MATEPEDVPETKPTQPSEASKFIYLGSQGVIIVKVGAAVLGALVLIWYLAFIAYPESNYWLLGIALGAIGLGIGIAGIFLGNIKVSNKRYMPPLNVILIIVSIIFLLIMPIFGSWEDPDTIGKALWEVGNMVMVLIFAIFFLCYVELAHASIRFSQVDEYATSHNLREFSVNSVVNNYFIWFGILISIITVISLIVLLLQIGLSGTIRDVAPQFGYSLEYNSIYSILISIAIIFVPIGIVTSFVYGLFFKSRRSIVVKGKEDVVARRPDMVKVK